MGGRRNWFTSRNGLILSVFRPRVSLTDFEYVEIRKLAKARGQSVQQWLDEAASEGVAIKLTYRYAHAGLRESSEAPPNLGHNPEPIKVKDVPVCRTCGIRAPWCKCGGGNYE